jgi:hypothetical protein
MNSNSTYLVTILMPKPRGRPSLTQGVVSAISVNDAIEIAKNYYPVGTMGWPKDAQFSAIRIPDNTFFRV